MTTQEEIEKVHGQGTHVTILGAGATYASTLRNPEKNGKKLPLMKNIVDIVDLNYLVSKLPKEYQILREDFEKLYSKIANNPDFSNEKWVIENKIY